MAIYNVVADRYSSAEMASIFDTNNRVIAERQFWLRVLKAQIEAGLEIDSSVIDDYEKVIDDVDLDSIRQREMVLKHDIPARLAEINELAGHQHFHKAMTSRDLTENVELIIMKQALELVMERTVALIARLTEHMVEHEALELVARTHNVPAQPTTFGKRLAQVVEELCDGHSQLRYVYDSLKFRGIKGPVGSMQDQISLLGSEQAARSVEQSVANHFGFESAYDAVGQVYPRSMDYGVASALFKLAAAPSTFATTLRLMAGSDLASEGFGKSQVGSSAMPHKMNARSCERINGLYQVLRGYVTMVESLSGAQWNEGDVSCSVVRRVAIPNLFLAIDGLFETTFAVLRGLTLFPAIISAELDRYLPFLSSTTLLVHAVQAGVGRDDAHEIIKEHAVATAIDMRNGKCDGSDLLNRLGADARFPGDLAEIEAALESAGGLLGAIPSQITAVKSKAHEIINTSIGNSDYSGAEIL